MESVKIGGLTYTVKKVSDLQGKEGDWGRIQYKTQEITLDDSLKEQEEIMNQYLGILEARALFENVNL